KIPTGKDAAVQFYDVSGERIALLSWEDPTQVNDGSEFHGTSLFRMSAGTSFDLGRITFSRLVADPTGPVLAVPTNSPTEADLDEDGVPDGMQSNLSVSSDSNGNGTPDSFEGIEAETPDCETPTAGPLYGKLSFLLEQKG